MPVSLSLISKSKHTLIIQRGNMLKAAAEIDQIIKGVKTGNAWRELQIMALSLSHPRK